jgi:nucleoside-diphosphate-sugar epimerase
MEGNTMKIFVAGSTGVVGKILVPQLIERGHEVFALVRNSQKSKDVKAAGAKAIIANALDKIELTESIKKTEPEVIIHQLTSLSNASGNFKKFDEEFELTNRFRTEATDTLISAACLVGARRFIAQSFCGWPFARERGPIKSEEDPLDPNPPAGFKRTLQAIKYLEKAVKSVTDFEALALRYGIFYGPDTGFSKDGLIATLLRKHKMPIVGNGNGVWSFIHINDAVSATVNAISQGKPGIYNIVDNEPAPVKYWLPFLAEILETKPPSKIPAWIAQLIIGKAGVSMMTQIRGGSNAKAKRELLWKPVYSSWRQGFKEGLS